MSWIIYIIMAGIAAAVTALVVRPVGRGKAGYAIICLIPLLSVAIYTFTGRPDLPSTSALSADGMGGRHLLMLAERPMETLHQNPGDLGALLAMAEISGRLGKAADRKEFLRRALKVARKTEDVRLEKIEAELQSP